MQLYLNTFVSRIMNGGGHHGAQGDSELGHFANSPPSQACVYLICVTYCPNFENNSKKSNFTLSPPPLSLSLITIIPIITIALFFLRRTRLNMERFVQFQGVCPLTIPSYIKNKRQLSLSQKCDLTFMIDSHLIKNFQANSFLSLFSL